MVITKKYEILQELPNVTQTQSEYMLLENDTNRFAYCRVATNLQFIKNTTSAKHSKRDMPVPSFLLICCSISNGFRNHVTVLPLSTKEENAASALGPDQLYMKYRNCSEHIKYLCNLLLPLERQSF